MFYLFVYDIYYPAGGLNDLKGQYPTLEMAKEAAEQIAGDSVIIATLDSENRIKEIAWFEHNQWLSDDGEAVENE